MTTHSIADPLAESHMRMANELLDLLAENKELRAEIARRDAYESVVASVVGEAFTAEALEAEAEAFDLPVWPVPFPNRFPIYNTWQEVPDGVRYESAAEGGMDVWENRDGVRYWVTNPEDEHQSNVRWMNELAPFVEVK